ncbi:Hypothetical protein A7982_01942 [Minicystis rosea]|nr:Hypothetical protein A7982_01942 [Minicystis rosea]
MRLRHEVMPRAPRFDVVLAAIPADRPAGIAEIAAAAQREPQDLALVLRALHDRGDIMSSPEGWRRACSISGQPDR